MISQEYSNQVRRASIPACTHIPPRMPYCIKSVRFATCSHNFSFKSRKGFRSRIISSRSLKSSSSFSNWRDSIFKALDMIKTWKLFENFQNYFSQMRIIIHHLNLSCINSSNLISHFVDTVIWRYWGRKHFSCNIVGDRNGIFLTVQINRKMTQLK